MEGIGQAFYFKLLILDYFRLKVVLYIYTYVYICVYVCVYICIYTYIHIYTYSRVPFSPSPHRTVTKNRKPTLAHCQLNDRPYLDFTNIFTNTLFLFQDLICNLTLYLVTISPQSLPVCLRMKSCNYHKNYHKNILSSAYQGIQDATYVLLLVVFSWITWLNWCPLDFHTGKVTLQC